MHAVRGSVNVIDVPTDAQLDGVHDVGSAEQPASARDVVRAVAVDRRAIRRGAGSVPERPGEPTPIQHVVYIIRENRTYDQILGDIGKGASDPSLVMYGRDVTPNAHALAEQFVAARSLLRVGGNSADGHNWLTQGIETDYPMWPLYYGRSYPSEGVDPLAYSSGGFIWEAAESKGKCVTVFGEYATSIQEPKAALAHAAPRAVPRLAAARSGVLPRAAEEGVRHALRHPSLDKLSSASTPAGRKTVPDVVKADVIIDHLREWEAKKSMPNLTMVILPSDHTRGNVGRTGARRRPASPTTISPSAASSSRSRTRRFWKSMAILVVEDDAQDGVDHIDGHRTVALVASPYARRGIIDSTFYSQPSMVKTIELMLGLPAIQRVRSRRHRHARQLHRRRSAARTSRRIPRSCRSSRSTS